jgi:hypothetical protein
MFCPQRRREGKPPLTIEQIRRDQAAFLEQGEQRAEANVRALLLRLMSTPSGRDKVRDIVVEILQAEPSFNLPSQTHSPPPALSIFPLSREPTALSSPNTAEGVSARVDTTATGDAREAGGGLSGAAVASADQKIIPLGDDGGDDQPLKKKRKVIEQSTRTH